MIYFDTSYIIKCYLAEPGSPDVLELAQNTSGLASCILGRIEFFSGLHRHLREKRITTAEHKKVVKLFESDEKNGVWTWFPMTNTLAKMACNHFSHLPSDQFLRSFDAIHLTCASEQGFPEIYSNDKHLLTAAPLFNLAGKNVIP
ncbi:MAG: type II toxin-antitoxin system VapC family toxin [Verrucomicrobiota bacterium]|nr:type II toxin-antitoxin system VapC family toxin [Verrucomicrobiota bacterium]